MQSQAPTLVLTKQVDGAMRNVGMVCLAFSPTDRKYLRNVTSYYLCHSAAAKAPQPGERRSVGQSAAEPPTAAGLRCSDFNSEGQFVC